MKKLNNKQQKEVLGGATYHYHWFCSVNRFTSAKYTTSNSAAYAAGVHAEKYGHHKQTTYGGCSSSW